MPTPTTPPGGVSLTQGRLYILTAAVLWSSSGFFGKVLTQPTSLGLNVPRLEPLQLAFFRVFFAAVVLAPLVRRSELRCSPGVLGMGLSFAAMNALFVSALALGKAANAILLQYTAPMWMYLASVFLLGEPSDRRSSVVLLLGMAGVGVILAGGWQGGESVAVIALALGSGVAYAAVLIGLRVLRGHAPAWLTLWNHGCAALALLPLMFWYVSPSPPQLAVLFLFGALQMGLPYFLVARGLRAVSPQEAGAITLLEPLLIALWAYLVSPATEEPTAFMYAGGALILGGLAYRYWPRRNSVVAA